MSTTPAYEYYGLLAHTWDLFRGDTSQWEDRFFYREVIRRYGEPVLDVGCGTGRLLLDYLSQGIDIDGVDNSPEMLALSKEKAASSNLEPHLYQQSMEALRLPRQYRTILVPSSSFQLLVDDDKPRQAIRAFFDHLHPGGALVMPFMLLRKEDDPLETKWEMTGEKTRLEDGALIRRWSRAWYDLAQHLESTEDRYEVIRDGQVIAEELHHRSPATRWYTRQQAIDLYQEAGFVDITLTSQFTFEPVKDEDWFYNIIGIKK
jgi:ubiquinone/menaquinone biosynthesis C-methylase UbiE